MTYTSRFVGIDISKSAFDICVLPDGRSARFANTAAGIADFIAFIGQLDRVERLVLEPTGGYERLGVTRGTTGDTGLSKLETPGIKIVRFDDESTNMTAFASGQVDIVVQELAVISRLTEQNPAKEIEKKFVIADFNVGIGLRKNDETLKAYLHAWVRNNLKSP